MTETVGILGELAVGKTLCRIRRQGVGRTPSALCWIICSPAKPISVAETTETLWRRDRPLLILAIVLLLAGIQLLCFGLLAELLMRTYHESQDRPIYRVREIIK